MNLHKGIKDTRGDPEVLLAQECRKRFEGVLPPQGLFSVLTGGLLSLNHRLKHCQELFLDTGHKLNWEDTGALREDSCHQSEQRFESRVTGVRATTSRQDRWD